MTQADLSRWIWPTLTAMGLATLLAANFDTRIDLDQIHLPPSKTHILGTDQLGRDVFIRCTQALQQALYFGLSAWMISIALGLIVGFIAGTIRNETGRILIEAVIGVCYLLPIILLVGALSTALPDTRWAGFLAVILIMWAWPARITRKVTVATNSSSINRMALGIGMSGWWRYANIFLPATAPPVLVGSGALLIEIFAIDLVLSIVGFNASPSISTFGSLLKDGVLYSNIAYWSLWAPVCSIAITGFVFRSLFQAFASSAELADR